MSEEELDKLENEFDYLPVIKFLRLEKFIKENYVSKDSYTNLKQIEQEHKKINGELREELKKRKRNIAFLQSQLDIANANIIHLKIAKEEAEELLENSVSKDKIREKIEEVKSIENASIADILESEKEFCIDILEELL